MRYCMHFYLKWHRNYAWSKLELRYLLNKKQTSNFDHAQFLHQLRQKFIQYLILKLQSIVKKGGKGQRMFAFLCSKIALCIWDFQYIKWGLSILICTPLYQCMRKALDPGGSGRGANVPSATQELCIKMSFSGFNLWSNLYLILTKFGQHYHFISNST